MRKCISAVAILAVGFVAGLSVKQLGVHAEAMGAGGGTPAGNGDVDGDGKYSITDAIYFLQWRFLADRRRLKIAMALRRDSLELESTTVYRHSMDRSWIATIPARFRSRTRPLSPVAHGRKVHRQR